MTEFSHLLGDVYNAFEGSPSAHAYSERHGITAQAVLTVTDDEIADLIASHLGPRIKDKTVVEIGGGLGLLACHYG